MDARELQKQIEEKRSELDKLVITQISDLSTEDVVTLSNELDSLIAAYINLANRKEKP